MGTKDSQVRNLEAKLFYLKFDGNWFQFMNKIQGLVNILKALKEKLSKSLIMLSFTLRTTVEKIDGEVTEARLL